MPPAPKPEVQHRKPRLGVRVLPKGARIGIPAPDWPLEEPATEAEQRFWERHWQKPQATVWAELELYEEVARYVRAYLKSMQPDAPVSGIGPVTSMAKELGLTPQGMRMLLWTVAEDSTADSPQSTELTSNVTDIRNRIRAVS